MEKGSAVLIRQGIYIMTDSPNRHRKAEVIATLEEILVELDNLDFSLPALKVVEALEILSHNAEDS